jgi:hypothetical protein
MSNAGVPQLTAPWTRTTNILGRNPVKEKDSSRVVLDALLAGFHPSAHHFGYLDVGKRKLVP